MCLISTDFTMQWSEDLQCYFGYGWKAIVHKAHKPNVWLKASGDRDKLKLDTKDTVSKPKKIPSVRDLDGYGKLYPAGFHIFLNKKDAENYEYRYGRLVKMVAFTDVLAFGKNRVKHGVDGPCVIAQYMWIFP